MSDYAQRIEELRTSPSFAGASLEEQRTQFYEVLRDSALELPEFAEADPEFQVNYLRERMDQDFQTEYESQEMAQFSQRLLTDYANGVVGARQMMIQAYQSTELADNAPFILGLLNQIPDPDRVYQDLRLPSMYEGNPLELNRTRGADDNKLRYDIQQAFLASGDTEAQRLIDDRRINRTTIAASVFEEAAIALLSAGVGNLVTRGVKVSSGLGRIGSWFARNTPGLLAEAGIEGVRGMLDYVRRDLNSGEDPSIGGASLAFGAHAAIDLAFSHAATALFDGLRLARGTARARQAAKYNIEIAEELGPQVARGRVDLDTADLSPLADPDQIRFRSARQLTDDSFTKINNGQLLSELSPLEQANVRLFEHDFALSRLPDGKYIAQPYNNIRQGRVFNNLLEAEEFVGARLNNKYKQLRRALDNGEPGAAEAIAEFLGNHPETNYYFARNIAKQSANFSDMGKGFIQPGDRFFVNELEFNRILNAKEGAYIRFDSGLTDDVLKAGKAPYGTRDMVRVSPNQSGDSLYYVGNANKVANQLEYDRAMEVAQRNLASKDYGSATLDELVRDDLVRQGYNAVQLEDGGAILLHSYNVKTANRYINPATGKIGSLAGSRTPLKPVQPRVVIDAGTNAADLAKSPRQFSELGTHVFSGKVDSSRVKSYADSFLSAKGLDNANISVRTNANGFTRVSRGADGKINISIPREITDPATQRSTYRQLMRGLEDVSPGAGAKADSYIKQFRSHQKSYLTGFSSSTDSSAWVDSIAKSSNVRLFEQTADGYRWVDSRNGIEYVGKTNNEFVRDVAVSEMDLLSFERALNDAGFATKVNGDGLELWVLDPKGNTLASGNNYVQIAKDLDFYPNRLPSSLAPDLAIIEEVPAMSLKAAREAAAGTAPDIMHFMGQFEDYHRTLTGNVRLRTKNGNSVMKLGKANYQVTINEIGYRRTFDNFEDAKRFLNGEWAEFDNLRYAAHDKGLRLWYEDGQFKLQRGSENVLAGSREELMAHLAASPNPTFGKELLPEDVMRGLDDLNIELTLPKGFNRFSFRPEDMNPLKDFRRLTDPGSMAMRDKWGPKVEALRRLSKKVDSKIGGTAFGDTFEQLHKNVRLANGATYRDHKVLTDMFHDQGGRRLIPKERRIGIMQYMENMTTNPEIARKVIDDFHLTNYDIETVVPALRSFYERKASELAIPFSKLLDDYQPRMRRMLRDRLAAEDGDILVKEFLAKNPKFATLLNKQGLEFAHRYERLSDMRQAFMEDDALSAAYRYTQAGNNEFHVKSTFDDLQRLMSDNRDNIVGDGYVTAINSYYDSAVLPQSVMHRSSMYKSARNFFSRAGLDPDSANDVLDILLSMPYMSSMSFRPWLPFRNLFQTMTILSARTGNPAVNLAAWKDMLSGPKLSKTLDDMIDMGLLHARRSGQAGAYLDQMRYYSDTAIGKAKRFFNTLSEKGLAVYSWSDDVTRAVAYNASNRMFDRGLRKVGGFSADMDINAFMRASMADGIADGAQRQLRGYIQAGDERAARAVLARENIDMTMFDYHATNKPIGANSTMGHLFYQFGTYSFSFAQTMAHMFTRGSIGNRLKSATAMFGSFAAVALMMDQAGVDNSSFLPHQVVMFNGGPYFQMMVDAASSLSPGARGAMAQRDLMRNFGISPSASGVEFKWPTLLPGGMQLKYFERANEYWQDGDYWHSFLAMTTTPEARSGTR